MLYKNLIIKTKLEDVVELQKYLFKLKYFWYDHQYHVKDRQIKKFKNNLQEYFYIGVGKSCDIFFIANYTFPSIKKAYDYNRYTIITYEQLMRKIKIKKINECQK